MDRKAVERAAETGALTVFIQPQINADDRGVAAGEVLARWYADDGRLMLPGEFVPELEKNGDIDALDRAVVRIAAGLAAERRGQKNVRLSVNVSPLGKLTADDILREVEAAGGEPEELCIEITESPAAGDDALCRFAGELKEMGFSVSVDDFGAGYSSFLRMARLPADEVKLDRAFSLGLTDPRARRAAAFAAASALGLGLSVVAEGVETKEQEEFFRSAGCTVLQGFYYAPPLMSADFFSLL